jgi:hypothetical protein
MNVNVLVGKTLKEIKVRSDYIKFYCESGEIYKIYHQQD